MKIVHVIARFNVGGTATWISNLSEELVKMGHEVILISGNVENNEIEDERFALLNGIRVAGLSRTVSLYNDLKVIFQLRRLFASLNPDVINTHTSKAGVVGRIANLLLLSKRFPLVHTIHGHLLVGYFSRIKVRLVIIIERILGHCSTMILFAGRKVATECLDARIITSCPYQIVKPGLRKLHYLDRQQLRMKHDIDKNAVVIGWLARFASVKRPDRVIALAEKFPEVTFLMGGDGELFNETLIRAPRNCKLIGWVRPEQFWPMCDIALLTSENEAVPISLIEAQFASIPALATNAGSTSEVVIDGATGWLADKNEDSLISRLNAILSNQDWELFGEKARTYAQSEFTVEKQANDHLNAYRKAISLGY